RWCSGRPPLRPEHPRRRRPGRAAPGVRVRRPRTGRGVEPGDRPGRAGRRRTPGQPALGGARGAGPDDDLGVAAARRAGRAQGRRGCPVVTGFLATAGEVVAVTAPPAAARLVEQAAGERLAATAPAAPTVLLDLQADNRPFDRAGLRPLTRGAYSGGGRVLLLDACSSGFDLLVTAGEPAGTLAVLARYRPATRTRAANLALAGRFRLLAGQTLLHYPVLWRSGWRGRVPLHAATVAFGGGVLLLAGETECFGLAEPLRVDGSGRPGRTSHGRRAAPFGHRAARLAPDRVVVLERGPRTEVARIGAPEAARSLGAGTYAAGELRRYWAFAATLALGTGIGPVHPPVTAIAAGYADRSPCLRVRVGDHDAVDLERL